MRLFKRKDDLYLSDRQPLTLGGAILLAITYLILIAWAFAILWPLYQMVLSAFNGRQQQYLRLNDNFIFSKKHFQHLFQNTLFLTWTKNTIFIAVATAILTLIVVSFTGYAYSRYRFKGKKASLLSMMLVHTIPTYAGITAYFTMYSVIASGYPSFSRQMMLVLIYAGGGIANNTFILKGYIDSLSKELDDAAKIDGCSDFQVYR